MGLKDLVNKGRCLVGLHDGEWRVVAPRNCTFVRVCERCQLESRRVDHLWPQWTYRGDQACDQSRTCSRCSAEEQRLQHMWGVAAYVTAESCNRQHTCSRCAATSPADAQHQFDAWRFTGSNDCNQLQLCSRCHADGASRRVEHAWTDWQHSNTRNGLERVCRRCGDLQVQPSPPPLPPTRNEAGQPSPHRAAPPVFSDDDVTDLLRRAGAPEEEDPPASRVRGDVVEQATAHSDSPARGADMVMQALGDSMFAEELKGNLADALERANAAFAAADTASGRADALITWAFVSVLRGEPAPVEGLSATVASLMPGDANRRLRALSCEILATCQRYNRFPDGTGAGATDVNARWQVSDLMPVDAEWRAALQASSDGTAQFDAWLTYSFLGQLETIRYTLDRSRYLPLPMPRDEFMSAALADPERLRAMADSRGTPRLRAFAEWVMADLQRRAGDMSAAASQLQRARASYHEANDAAGEALCAMTQTDWRVAPFSSPLVWNFAVVDSTSQGSNLPMQLEADEFSRGENASVRRGRCALSPGRRHAWPCGD